jgi:hypothetical protein
MHPVERSHGVNPAAHTGGQDRVTREYAHVLDDDHGSWAFNSLLPVWDQDPLRRLLRVKHDEQ